MSQQALFLLVAFMGYSLYSSVIGKVTSYAPSLVILAIYMTTGAVVSWVWVLKERLQGTITVLSLGQFAAICSVGLIVFVSDYAYTKLFVLKVPFPIIYGFIAWVAVGTMIFYSIFSASWPSWKQAMGVVICCYGAYVINTERFGPP